MHQRMLRLPEVECRTALSRSTLYDMMNEDRFPRPVRLGKRAVRWREADVTSWLEERAAATD